MGLSKVDPMERDCPLRILAVVEWYPPAFKAGGPIQSVYNLFQLMRAETDHELEVVCGDRDLGSATPLDDIQTDVPHERDGIRVTYRSSVSWKWWNEKLGGSGGDLVPDVIYINSLFSLPFALYPMLVARALGIRVVLAPRGMLGLGALSIKPRRKKFFLIAARVFGLFRNVRWHASTVNECSEVLAHFPKANAHIALNVPLFEANVKPLKSSEAMTWVMVGRIHPIKNLHFALEALQKVNLNGKSLRIELVGLAEDEEYLKRLVLLSKPGVEVVHVGAIAPHELGKIWSRSHALLMPTRHENFGHVVVEAWAHGRPVLLSDKTPWRDLKKAGLGWDLPLTQAAWAEGLSEALTWDDEHWIALSKSCVEKHKSILENPQLIRENRALFEAE